ncbi:hypothetical protein [Sphingosinithalassobacter sp. CS137]|uniref:hypothetical protein n=1 Tax=Sphingosinithalassobacter sp. CS137 TaxID=2762748 RepID=UPI00165DA9A7|nr:hypothetical protein [Sphingosinithalassobacter sp. CS137]
MADEDTPLPTGEHITRQYQQMRPLLGLLGLFSGDVRRQARELEKQFADVERMKEDRQKFAARFGPRGWTIFDRLSVEALRVAVAESDDNLADQGLVAHHLDADILSFLGYRFNTSRFEAWHDIYGRAVERLLAQDYLSAVPLLLIIIDGICTTKTGKHPFSGGADAPVFDTETTGPGGLSDGLAILGATRRKLATNPIESPYRHGILHGLNPNFGNALVAAKTVNLLQTMVDYFDRREDEEERIAKAAKDQREPSWSELAATMSATQDTKRRIEAWKARPAVSGHSLAELGKPHSVEAGSPEAAAATYLDAIAARNFGTLAQMTIDYPLRSIGYRAGRHREELGDLKLTSWSITGVRDEAPAISEVDVAVEGILNDSPWSGTQVMRLIYNHEKFEVRVRGAPDGRWTVMPNFLPTLWGTAVASFNVAASPSDEN